MSARSSVRVLRKTRRARDLADRQVRVVGVVQGGRVRLAREFIHPARLRMVSKTAELLLGRVVVLVWHAVRTLYFFLGCLIH